MSDPNRVFKIYVNSIRAMIFYNPYNPYQTKGIRESTCWALAGCLVRISDLCMQNILIGFHGLRFYTAQRSGQATTEISMQVRNTANRFGVVSISLHWLVAIAVFGLFGLGFWMVDLSYYDDWYRTGPDIHRSIGILLFAAMGLRLAWRLANPVPGPLPNHTRFEVLAAHAAHLVLYLLVFVAMISGYLISSADGSSVSVFDWFQVPSMTGQVKGLEDTAGVVHYWSTWALVVLAGLHSLAAVKHHFIDRDDTLRRMLGTDRRKQ
ncbi:MAG: cytochrome B561 [Marinobacter sp. HL-58]|nr:MAG: cytochrome B561 [Marinobacter sp. HL-58]